MPTTRPSTPQQWSSDYISACSIYVNMYTKYIFVLVCYTKIGCISDIFVVALVMWYNHTWCIVCACRVYVNVFKHHFIFLFSYTVFFADSCSFEIALCIQYHSVLWRCVCSCEGVAQCISVATPCVRQQLFKHLDHLSLICTHHREKTHFMTSQNLLEYGIPLYGMF